MEGATLMGAETPGDRWVAGDAYELYVGRWSRRVAPRFLDWLGEPPGQRWLDVGCGTGALVGAILDRCEPDTVVGVEPSPGFLAKARERLSGRARLLQGDAAHIPLPDHSVDVVASALVLNFVPDVQAGLREMVRVTAPGGRVAAYVWDYAQGMELIRHFWDAAVITDASARPLDEAVRFPLCSPAALTRAFEAVGLGEIEMSALEVETVFADFEDYWSPFLGAQGPAPTYLASLPESARERLRRTLSDRLPRAPDGTIRLRARAWAVAGRAGS